MCDCNICQRIRENRVRLQCVPNESHACFMKLFGDLLEVEQERDYYEAILNGVWPDAEGILEGKLKKIRKS